MFLWVVSFFIVAFGQPVWSSWLASLSACCGFALFWQTLLTIPSAKKRFFSATLWYAAVQIVQLSWVLSHPFLYIYPILAVVAFLFGCQWGIIAIFIRQKNLYSLLNLLSIAALWTILEWSRLFILSGLPFNPIGLTLSGYLWPLQLASIGGVYGMTFLVIFTNLVLLSAYNNHFVNWKKKLLYLVSGFLIVFPYLFGWLHYSMHSAKLREDSSVLNVVLVQPADPVETQFSFQSAEESRLSALDKWKKILSTLQIHSDKSIDLIVLPEYIVPYGTFHLVYPLEEVHALFQTIFADQFNLSLSEESMHKDVVETYQGERLMVSNAYIAQKIASLFQADVVVGLEDSVYVDVLKRQSETYSAAFHFKPLEEFPKRYEKRILVPMGEYIPFEWCRRLAAKYGIQGSFNPGKEAFVFDGIIPFSPLICYEEMYGNLTRESRLKGAQMLVNLTNDGWFPNSFLPKQHFDHARLRTVENGIALVRSCNTGITGGIDALGNIIGIIDGDWLKLQNERQSLYLSLPLYYYDTFYTKWGDSFILTFSLLFLMLNCAILMIKR